MTRVYRLLVLLLLASSLPLMGMVRPTEPEVPRTQRVAQPQVQAKLVPPSRVSRATAEVSRWIREVNDDIGLREARRLARLVVDSARRHDVDHKLVAALVAQESRFESDAVSPVGAQGLGQLMPETAAELGVEDPFDPAQNLDGSVRYLDSLLDQWEGRPDQIELALASYNAGPGAVASYGGIPPYEETQNYVRLITDSHERLLRSRA